MRLLRSHQNPEDLGIQFSSFASPLLLHYPVFKPTSSASAMQPSTANSSETSAAQETKGTSSDLILVPSGGSSLIFYDLPACAKWVFGSILYLAIPVCRRILRIEDVLEKEVVDVAEIVKKVAEVTKKVSSDIAEALPADSSLKQLATEVEGEAEVVYMDAEKTEAVIHKIHSKTRNRLAQQRLNDLVFVKYNRALRRRYDARDRIDPISLTDIDDSNEWLMGRMEADTEAEQEEELVFDDEFLTWGTVARATGVEEESSRTRLSKGKNALRTKIFEKENISKTKVPTPVVFRDDAEVDEEEAEYNEEEEDYSDNEEDDENMVFSEDE